MNRQQRIGTVVFLLVAVLITREVLIHKEITALQNDISSQLQDRFTQATHQGRVQELAAASTVFQSYVEPVYSSSSRLLWPYSRDQVSRDWKRVIFQKLDDQLFATQQRLQMEMQKSLKDSSQKEASTARLKEIISIRKTFTTDPQFAEAIETELQLISQAAQEKDRLLLEQIGIEGRASIQRLNAKLKRFDHSKFSAYISSGNYSREIEQPVIDLILQLKLEATRRGAWAEYQRTLQDSMKNKKAKLLSNSKRATDQQDDSKRIADLFNSIAKSIDEQPQQLTVQAPETEAPLPVYSNPAGPDYQ